MLLAFFVAESSVVTATALVLAVGGIVSGVGGVVIQRRNAATSADVSYVDRNLAAMQRIIDLQAVEDKRLRATNEERLKRIDTLEDELAAVTAELATVRAECDDCLKRVRTIERNGSS